MRRCWRTAIAIRSTALTWRARTRTTRISMPGFRRGRSRIRGRTRSRRRCIRPKRIFCISSPSRRAAVTSFHTTWRDMKKPPEPSGKKRGKQAELAAWLERSQAARIGEAELGEIAAALAPVSENYLRKLLKHSGVLLDAMVEGVRQGSLEELEASLMALAGEYERGDAMRRHAVRRV